MYFPTAILHTAEPRWSPVVSALNGACQGAGDRRVSVLWGFPLCRYKKGEGLVVVLKEEGEGVDIKEFFKLKSNEIFPNSHLFKVNLSVKAPEEFETAKGYVEISSLPSSDFTRALDFVIDVLLAFTSPSFWKKAMNNELTTSFQIKQSLLERLPSELPDFPAHITAPVFSDMVCGHPYNAMDSAADKARRLCKRVNSEFNSAAVDDATDKETLSSLQFNLFSRHQSCILTPPFMCDYGFNIHWGNNGYANNGCTFLDCGLIILGENVLIGPNTDIYTVEHPLQAALRNTAIEYTAPVIIGNSVWIGGKVVIVAGVRIGDNAVVAAGSVVVKDVPANSVVAGNPARIVKMIEQ